MVVATRRVFVCLTLTLVLHSFSNSSLINFTSNYFSWHADRIGVHHFSIITVSLELFELNHLVYVYNFMDLPDQQVTVCNGWLAPGMLNSWVALFTLLLFVSEACRRHRNYLAYMTYLFLLMLSADDINPNPEHALQSLPQPGEFLTSTFSNGLPTPDHVVHQRCVSQFSSMALAPRDVIVTILPTTADGHCFIHTLQTSIILYLHRDFTYVDLLHRLRNEVTLYEDLYLGFYAGSKQIFRYESTRYFLSEVYNSNFGDIIPLIAANALNTQIIICLSRTFRFSIAALFNRFDVRQLPGRLSY